MIDLRFTIQLILAAGLTTAGLPACKAIRSPAQPDSILLGSDLKQIEARSDRLLEEFQLCNADLRTNCFNFWPTVAVGEDRKLKDNAAVLAHLSMVAYQEKQAVQAWAVKAGFIAALFEDSGSTQMYLFVHPAFNVLAFRGSQAVAEDWLTNLSVLLNPIGSPKIHVGFRKAYERIAGRIEVLLGKNGKPGVLENASRPLWSTGHSLGGALAVTSAIQYHQATGRRHDGVITFGSPRVFNTQTKRDFDNAAFSKTHIRYVYGSDGVTQVPNNLWGYRHFHPAIYLEQGTCKPLPDPAPNSAEESDDAGLIDRIRDKIRTAFRQAQRNQLLVSTNLCQIKDHCVVGYVECANQLSGR